MDNFLDPDPDIYDSPQKDSDIYDALQMIVEVGEKDSNAVYEYLVGLDHDFTDAVYLTTLADFLHLDLRFKIEDLQKNLDHYKGEVSRLTAIDKLLREEMLAVMLNGNMSAINLNYGIVLKVADSTESLVPQRTPTADDAKAWGAYIKAELSWKVAVIKKAIKEGMLSKEDVAKAGFDFVSNKHLTINQRTESPEFGD